MFPKVNVQHAVFKPQTVNNSHAPAAQLKAPPPGCKYNPNFDTFVCNIGGGGVGR